MILSDLIIPPCSKHSTLLLASHPAFLAVHLLFVLGGFSGGECLFPPRGSNAHSWTHHPLLSRPVVSFLGGQGHFQQHPVVCSCAWAYSGRATFILRLSALGIFDLPLRRWFQLRRPSHIFMWMGLCMATYTPWVDSPWSSYSILLTLSSRVSFTSKMMATLHWSIPAHISQHAESPTCTPSQPHCKNHLHTTH